MRSRSRSRRKPEGPIIHREGDPNPHFWINVMVAVCVFMLGLLFFNTENEPQLENMASVVKVSSEFQGVPVRNRKVYYAVLKIDNEERNLYYYSKSPIPFVEGQRVKVSYHYELFFKKRAQGFIDSIQ